MKISFKLLLITMVIVSCLSPEERKQKLQKAILGEDLNKNGVNDKVDFWITSNLKDRDLSMATTGYAKYLREAMKFRADKEKSIEMFYRKSQYSDCIFQLVSYPKSAEISAKVIELMTGTKEAYRAYRLADSNFGGQARVSYSNKYDACPFLKDEQKSKEK